jgi:hypothetical protein
MAEDTEKQEGFFRQAGAVVSAAYNAAMKGGELQAAFRQGANELGAALKAFPDSIQVDEPGQVFNPLYSDIAADKRARAEGPEPVATSRLMSPGELAGGKSSGSVYGDTQSPGKQPLPSPGQIAVEQTPQQPDQGHGRGQDAGTVHGDSKQPLPSAGEIAKGNDPPAPPKTWGEQVKESSQHEGNDQNEQAKGHVVADEQRDQERGGRGR